MLIAVALAGVAYQLGLQAAFGGGGVAFGGWFTIGVIFAIFMTGGIGGFLIYGAVRRRTLLRVQTSGGTRKVTFQGKPDPNELHQYVRELSERFGCRVVFAADLA